MAQPPNRRRSSRDGRYSPLPVQTTDTGELSGNLFGPWGGGAEQLGSAGPYSGVQEVQLHAVIAGMSEQSQTDGSGKALVSMEAEGAGGWD